MRLDVEYDVECSGLQILKITYLRPCSAYFDPEAKSGSLDLAGLTRHFLSSRIKYIILWTN